MSAEFFRYTVAGIINTTVGYIVFLITFDLFKVSASVSNSVSYAVGLVIAYILNLLFVFRNSEHSNQAVIRFFAGFFVAYLVNLAVLNLAIDAGSLKPEYAQILAMGSYTISFYLINKFLVWKR